MAWNGKPKIYTRAQLDARWYEKVKSDPVRYEELKKKKNQWKKDNRIRKEKQFLKLLEIRERFNLDGNYY